MISSHALTNGSERSGPHNPDVVANIRTDESVRGREDESPPVTPDPTGRGFFNSQHSFRRIVGAGRGDGSDADQVGGLCMQGWRLFDSTTYMLHTLTHGI